MLCTFQHPPGAEARSFIASASVTALWLFAARVNITGYVAQARPCPCCGTVTEGGYRNMCGRGPASAGDLRAGREPDGWAPNFGLAGNAAAAPVPRHRRLDGMDGRDLREDRRAAVAASGFMERAREPLKTASAIHADEPPNRRRDQTSAFQPLERRARLSVAVACSPAAFGCMGTAREVCRNIADAGFVTHLGMRPG